MRSLRWRCWLSWSTCSLLLRQDGETLVFERYANVSLTSSFRWMELLSGYINVQEAMLSAYGISPMIVNLYVCRRLHSILFCLTAARAACIINWTTLLTSSIKAASTPTSPFVPSSPPLSDRLNARTATTPFFPAGSRSATLMLPCQRTPKRSSK
jgi:hypothetical protein